MDKVVHLLLACKIKSGPDQTVSVQLDSISMEQCVLNVSMVKNGIQPKQHVNVNQVTNGMDNIAKEPMNAVLTEFGILLTNNVFVLKTSTGVDMLAYQFLVVLEDNIGIKISRSVPVFLATNLMDLLVFYAQMENSGTKQA